MAGTNASTGGSTPNDTRYTKLRECGVGGMGHVWVALDHQFNREIAFKEIREDMADLAVVRAKFRREAEVTGQLEHPGVVPAYSLGTYPNGRPYFAMRFIRRTTLEREIGLFRSSKSLTPAARLLQFREILGRFIAVCNAIDYAHSRGVIHRDIKPSNIMNGLYGETLVIDWGVAKCTEVAPHGADQSPVRPSPDEALEETLAGSSVGTPSYMSPEQAEGRVDLHLPTTDVYCLGATLYHIFTGQSPVKGDNTGEILDKVKLGDFPHPRKIDKSIPRSLEAICLKAMALKPENRYQSAKDLGDDIKRWLADEAVSCYVDFFPHRMARFVRHHRKAITTTLLVLIAVISAGAASIWYDRDRRERDRREQVRQSAERLVDRGEVLLASRKDDDAAAQFSEASAQLQQEADLESLRDRIHRGLGTAEARLRLTKFLATATDAEQHILGSLWTLLPHEDPGGRRRINPRSAGTSKLETGITQVNEALALYGLPDDQTAANDPPYLEPEEAARLRDRAAHSLFLLALAEERVGQGRAADQQVAFRNRACRLLEVAESLGNTSRSLYRYRSRFRKLLGRDADADQRLAEQIPPATFLDHHLLAVELAREQKKLAEAAIEYRIALAIRPGDYWTLYRLAKTLENQRQLPQAESLFRTIVFLRPNDATTHNTLGTVLSDQGKNEEAVAEFEAAIRADPDYLMAYGNMMKVQGNQKQVDAAEATFRRLLDRKPDAWEQARGWDFLGIAYERAQQDVKALERFDEAVRLDPENPGILRNRSLCLSRLRRHVEALADIDRAIALNTDDGELHYVRGLNFSYWGRDPKAARNNAEAMDRIKEAVAAYGDAIRLGHQPARYNRAVMLRQLGQFEKAIQDHDAILKANPNDAYALYERAMNRLNLMEYRIAINDLDRVLILDTPVAKALRVDAYLTRGKAWGDLGTEDDLKRSEADLDRAVELMPDALDRAIKRDPNDPDVYRSRGLTRMRRGHASDPAKPETDAQAESCRGGIADYRKYLELRPNAPDASSILNDLSSAYLKLGRIDEAIAVLGEAIKLKPNPSYYSNRGNIYLIRGDLELAITDFDAAVQLDPKHTRAWALRGQSRLRLWRFDDATADMDQALKLEPGFYETLVLRSLANLGGGRVDAARRDLEKVARDRPDHVRGKFSRGLLRYLDKKFPEAIVDLSAGTDDRILRPFGLPFRARAFLGLGAQGTAAAATDADELARLRPLDGFTIFEAARIHAATDLPAGRNRVFELLTQAIKQQPDLRDRLKSDPDLKCLQTDDRFNKLLEKP